MLFFTSICTILFSTGLLGIAFAQEETLSILSIQPVSPREIHITASDPILLPSEAGANAFLITDLSGNTLPLTKLVLQGRRITLFTFSQTPGAKYVLTLSDVVRGKTPQGEGWRAIPLKGGTPSYAFNGFTTGEERGEEEVTSPVVELPTAPSPLIASVSDIPFSSAPKSITQTMVFVVIGGLVGWFFSRRFGKES